MIVISEAGFLGYFATAVVVSAAATFSATYFLRRKNTDAARTAQAEAESGRLIEAARQQATEIMRQAESKASQMLQQTGTLTTELQEEIKRELSAAADEAAAQSEGHLRQLLAADEAQAEAVRKAIDADKERHEAKVAEILRVSEEKMRQTFAGDEQKAEQAILAVQEAAAKQAAKISERLNTRMEEMGKMMQDSVKAEQQKAEAEMEAYRAGRLQEWEKRLKERIPAAVEKILGEAVTLKDEDKYIREALEAVRREIG